MHLKKVALEDVSNCCTGCIQAREVLPCTMKCFDLNNGCDSHDNALYQHVIIRTKRKYEIVEKTLLCVKLSL